MDKARQKNLEYLFNPRSIAILGASSDLNKVSGRPLVYMLRFGYSGKIYPINPKYSEIAGVQCYPTLDDVPGEIDFLMAIIPAEEILPNLEVGLVLQDVSIRVLPITQWDVEEMISQIRGYKIPKGIRGKGPADIEVFSKVLLKVASLADELKDIVAEIDINPLIVLGRGKGAKAVDAIFLLHRQGSAFMNFERKALM